jgi:GNAT superfamily N-acetyltransferase
MPEGPISIHVRLIRPDDSDRIKDLFYGLSEDSIFFRFLIPLKSLRRQTLQEFYYVDQESDISLVAVAGNGKEGECEKIVAAGRYLLNRSTNQAEFALLVKDEYQNRGIGTFLLNQMMRIAKSKGVNAFIAYVHPKNVPMINFIHRTGKVIESRLSIEDNQYTFILRL